MPLFDVLMPVKNGEAFLEQAIHSIQQQTVKDWRLLVLDHGSTDRTPDIVQLMAQRDPRIQMHSFPAAPGLAGLLNEGLALVDAPYAMRMDADDESVPERMALTEAAFRADPGLALVGGQAVAIDPQGNVIGRHEVPTDTRVLGRVALFRNPFVHPAVCFNSATVADRQIRYGRSLYAHADPAADIHVPALAEDYLLFAELATEGRTANVDRDLLRYRHHAGGVSRKKYGDQLLVSAAISRHLGGLISRRSGLPAFDPVPFCSHGETLLNIYAEDDYLPHYEAMRSVLTRCGDVWKDAAVELDWRRVFVDRSPIAMLSRAAKRWVRCRPDRHERHTVRNAISKLLRVKPLISVPAMSTPQPSAHQADLPSPVSKQA